MADRLVITNGDVAADALREARIADEILPWRDILHEGPVPGGLGLEELSKVRAEFLSRRGWLSADELEAAFGARDATIRNHAAFGEVILWFEHDLYDQLQLLQILDFFADENRRTGLYLIQAGKYLARETPRALKSHLTLKEPVSEAHFALAKLAWTSFRSSSPEPLASLLRLSTHVLPFLRLAILRLLEELPSPGSGLSRTEWTILNLISQGIRKPRELFEAFAETEELTFIGDWSFYHALDQLGSGGAPLIAGFQRRSFSPAMSDEEREAYLESELTFTHLGYSVLTGAADAMKNRKTMRALGGFSIDSNAPWRWDRASRQLQAPPRN